MWFKSEYIDREGKKIKKRSNEEIYEDIYESIGEDHTPVRPFLDYGASYKEWIKETYEKGGIDLLMSELEKNDFLTEFVDPADCFILPFDVCSVSIELFYDHCDELRNYTISLIEFPDCWKIFQISYGSSDGPHEKPHSESLIKIKSSEKNPGEHLRKYVEATLEDIFWEFSEVAINDGVEDFVLKYIMDLGENKKFDYEEYIGISEPNNLTFPKKLKKKAFNKFIQEVKDDSFIEDQDRKKYVKKLKKQIDLLEEWVITNISEKLPDNRIPHQYPWID
jgi:hypothetical protein